MTITALFLTLLAHYPDVFPHRGRNDRLGKGRSHRAH